MFEYDANLSLWPRRQSSDKIRCGLCHSLDHGKVRFSILHQDCTPAGGHKDVDTMCYGKFASFQVIDRVAGKNAPRGPDGGSALVHPRAINSADIQYSATGKMRRCLYGMCLYGMKMRKRCGCSTLSSSPHGGGLAEPSAVLGLLILAQAVRLALLAVTCKAKPVSLPRAGVWWICQTAIPSACFAPSWFRGSMYGRYGGAYANAVCLQAHVCCSHTGHGQVLNNLWKWRRSIEVLLVPICLGAPMTAVSLEHEEARCRMVQGESSWAARRRSCLCYPILAQAFCVR